MNTKCEFDMMPFCHRGKSEQSGDVQMIVDITALTRRSILYPLIMLLVFALFCSAVGAHIYHKIDSGNIAWFSSGDAILFYIFMGSLLIGSGIWMGVAVYGYLRDLSGRKHTRRTVEEGRWPYGIFFTSEELVVREKDRYLYYSRSCVQDANIYVRQGWTKRYFINIIHTTDDGFERSTWLRSDYEYYTGECVDVVLAWIDSFEKCKKAIASQGNNRTRYDIVIQR